MSDDQENITISGTNAPETDFVKNLPDHRKTIVVTKDPK